MIPPGMSWALDWILRAIQYSLASWIGVWLLGQVSYYSFPSLAGAIWIDTGSLDTKYRIPSMLRRKDVIEPKHQAYYSRNGRRQESLHYKAMQDSHLFHFESLGLLAPE